MNTIDLILNEEWPQAVPHEIICQPDNENSKLERGEGIVELMIGKNIQKKTFLDFGCGEGHVVKAASRLASKAIGYDITQQGSLPWEQSPNLLTTDFKQIKSHAPFDIILLYDVMDHVQNKTVPQIVGQIKELCNRQTKVFIRFHPWCSRHGGHCYQKINKAFVHLFLTDSELKSLGLEPFEGQKITEPMKTYQSQWSDFEIIHQHTLKSNIEDFFRLPKIEQMGKQLLNVEFIDFVLRLKHGGSKLFI